LLLWIVGFPIARKDKRGVDLISDALPFGRLWYGQPAAISNAISYAKFRSRSRDSVIRVYDDAGNVIDTHEPLSLRGITTNGCFSSSVSELFIASP
jgi:hypothetical protein